MSTQILFTKEAKDKLLKGVNIMADAVSSTLGPRGQNVAIAKSTPQGMIYERLIIHDGVGVARSIDLPDEFENMGAQILKQAAQKQVDKVGDGTTLVMILAQSIIEECMQIVSTGVNPMALRKGLEVGSTKLIKKIERLATPITNFTEMKHIATISAEDDYLGNLVAETLEKVGKDGVIDVEESKGLETTVEYQQGMQLDKGYLHQLFITNPERMEAVFEDPQILITDKSITSLIPLSNLLNALTKDAVRRPLVIISPDISGEAFPLLIQNKLEGKLFTLCIKAPSFGQDQKNILQDIAILTGAKFITEDAGHKFEDVTIENLGEAGYVTSTKSESIISGGLGDKEAIAKRIASIKKELEEEGSDFDKERLKARLGKLTNGIAVINVGGATEVEMKERRERVIDAVSALRSAMNKGIVAGGEVVFLEVRESLGKSVTDRILFNTLSKPFKKLVENAGYDGGEMIARLEYKSKDKSKQKYIFSKKSGLSHKDIEKIDMDDPHQYIIVEGDPEKAVKALDIPLKNQGFDVTDGQFKDMISSGIVDPAEVLIEALKNSVSVAVQLISVNTVIVPIKDDFSKLFKK